MCNERSRGNTSSFILCRKVADGIVREWAQASGAHKVYWLIAETNGRARALYDRVATRSGFYRRLGFTIMDAEPDPRWPDRQR